MQMFKTSSMKRQKAGAMARFRTIEKAHEEIRQADSSTCLTKYRIRQLVIDGVIPSRKAGNRYMIDFDGLMEYLKGGNV